MNTELTITTERIDDFPLLLAVMQRLGLPEILDRHLKLHGSHKGLSWGWIGVIWLAHILSQGDHRKLPVQAWVRQAQETIVRITGLSELTELDFTDDRLTKLLTRLSQPVLWQAIEQELGANLIRVYALPTQRVRLDATTVSGYHADATSALFQFGHSKDDPTLRQVKVMLAALDPLGMPLVTEVVAGDEADDPLYVPAIARVLAIINVAGLLFVGDCKMSAVATRAYVQSLGHFYLCPLAQTGNTPSEMAQWIAAANAQPEALQTLHITAADGSKQLLAQGRTFERQLQVTTATGGQAWTERVLLVRMEGLRQRQLTSLNERLAKATTQLLALTPAPGRGKRQIQTEADLVTAATVILQRYEVEGLLTYTFERQETRRISYVGRGRGGAERPQQETVTVRYQLTTVERNATALAAHEQTLGWRVYVTNAPATELSWEEAILTYRDEWLIERGFHRLKGAPLSLDPLFVKRDDQVVGLTNLLSIAVRLLTLVEFVVRRNLKQNQELLVGLLPQNPKKGIDNPTTERLLQAFRDITLTIVNLPGQRIRHVTPLTALQVRILELLGLSPAVYTALAEN
jgi:transposase